MVLAITDIAEVIRKFLICLDIGGMAMAVLLGIDILLPCLRLRDLAKFPLFKWPIELVLDWIFHIPHGKVLHEIEETMAKRYAKRLATDAEVELLKDNTTRSSFLKRDFEDFGGHKVLFDGHNGVSYSDRIIDRQINKARGILPFNSILIATVSLETKLPASSATTKAASSSVASWLDSGSSMALAQLNAPIIAGLFISSILLLELFWVHWGKVKDYRTFREEMRHAVEMARDRSIVLDTSIFLSVACLLTIMFALLGVPILEARGWPYNLH